MESQRRILADRYELLAPLASGGMGRVWRARDLVLERPVAVKVLRSEFTADPTFRARFRAEAQHAALLFHPNIAAVFDYGELQEDGELLAHLVMELVDGEPLSTLLAREGRLAPRRTLEIVRQTAAALAAAHAAGVVHRDVKPANVLVGTDGIVKITDFGIAWSASSVPLTRTGQVIGTAHYLSPEQAQGGAATPASDVYAVGAVAYECLTGRRAFDGESSVQIALKQIHEEPAPLPPDVPAGVRALVGRAMAKDPAARFPDGAALRDAVDAVLATGPAAPASGPSGTAVLPLPVVVGTGAASPSTPPTPAPTGRPRAGAAVRRLALGAVVVLALVAGAVALLQTGTKAPASGATSSPATRATSAAASPSTVAVDPAAYAGRPVAEIQAELVARGLQVTLAPVETGHAPAGQVTAVEPAGALAPGSVVTVSYAVPPVVTQAPPPATTQAPKSPAEKAKGHGKKRHDGGED